MFERFTDRARRVIVLAQEEAKALQHNYIGTEHLLLGLIKEGEGVAAKVLAAQGVTLEGTRKQVEEMIGKGNAQSDGHIPFTPHARQVLELSLREALQLGHSYIGTEHILLGLIREGEGVGTQVLIKMDVDLGELRSATIDAIRGNTAADGDADKGQLANAGGVQDKSHKSGSAILDQFGRNLTAEAAEGKLDPVIGRTNEINRVMVILSRRTKNNPVLIGEPGVGKTAVVEGLAQKIHSGDVPETLKNKQVYSLDLASMVAGSRYRGDFEERLKKVLKEIKTRGDIVLFIDEIHNIVGAGSADGALGASDILKPMLARGELQTIGATTTDEYRKYIEKDAALERRFQPIQVQEPSVADTIEILKGLRERYENHHHVTITDGALQAAAELSARYIQDRNLPDKAIDLIDEAGARLRIKRLTEPPELKELDARISKISDEKDKAIKDQDFEKAAELRDSQEKLEAERKDKEKTWREGGSNVKMVVDEDQIAEVISSTTGIPVFKLTQAESKKLLGMEAELHKRIIGQDEAVSALSRSIRRTRVGLKDPKRPAGSFIFAGPTGVGKTELAKALAEFLFDDEDALIRVDMSEFSEKYAASRLFGAPPGYVGYEEGGELTEKVRRKPFSVVLFDEIEKAHPDIFNTLLQVLDDGHLTDGQGRKVDFKNTIIILTTNLGTKDIAKAANTGFTVASGGESSYERMKGQVTSELKQQFRPEFLNRLDDIIVFRQLTEPQVRQIVDLDLTDLNSRLFERHMSLELTAKAKDLLAQKGFDPLLGARPLRRVIQRDIEDAVSEQILMGKLNDGEKIMVDAEGEGILGDFTFTGVEQFQPSVISNHDDGDEGRSDSDDDGDATGDGGGDRPSDGSDGGSGTSMSKEAAPQEADLKVPQLVQSSVESGSQAESSNGAADSEDGRRAGDGSGDLD
ncbi:ATP-dependent clp protease [Bifidobacterium bombi DSM 19703]|uniref:ATP-dependent clp protease n=1 Tax=Bifidobacterium bombi DSM 19703 TaxID=1341695 RepID=A0A080N4G0_9BIFI|nr:ATP-dependent Clp protease ATP-binding subunit [Bifidobacterium bombi]KFF31325.1 ATP-dependent clp protease [Bifidobacterium bombi DSM 19703]